MTENKKETKSPIKDLPVRMPGQSLRESVDNLIDENVLPWVIGAVFAIVIAVHEWLAFLFNTPRLPWFLTAIATVVVLLAVVKIRQLYIQAKIFRLGQIGEEAVGQFLEEKLRPTGYQVLHDIVNDSGNVDHVVIGPSGIYTVETKTNSKPIKGQCIVTYDGEKVTVNGYQPERDPVVQAKAEAGWLSKLIESSTGKKFKVQPVVLYPGWYITSPAGWPEVLVMNEHSFISTLAKFKRQIDDADIHLITSRLKSYVINRQEKAKAVR